jgi:undecaprenyl-diphosphatase
VLGQQQAEEENGTSYQDGREREDEERNDGVGYPLPLMGNRPGVASLVASDTVQASRPEPPPARRLETPPVLDARPGGLAQRLGMRRLTDHHPAPVFATLVLCGFLLIAATTVGLGFLLVDGILSTRAVASADEQVNTWLAAHRTSGLTDASSIGSEIGSGFVIPAVVAVVIAWFSLRRHWRAAAFVLAAILVEVASYRAVMVFVHRHRPAVHRLEHLPVNASFPSGHVAASVAVYGGLALLLTSRYTNPWLRGGVWALAVTLPVAVGISRMYRGMHHPLDVLGGAAMGLGALMVALIAAQVTGVVVARRDHRRVAQEVR